MAPVPEIRDRAAGAQSCAPVRTNEKSPAAKFTTNNGSHGNHGGHLYALEALKKPAIATIAHTDSRYLMDGITKWLPRWKTKGWRTADNKPVKNVELWMELEKAIGEATRCHGAG